MRALTLILIAACGPKQPIVRASPDQCTRLFERMIELDWRSLGGDQVAGVDAQATHAVRIRDAKTASFMKVCTEHAQAVHVSCALDAISYNEALRCEAGFDVRVRSAP